MRATPRLGLGLSALSLCACTTVFFHDVTEREAPNDAGAACAPTAPLNLTLSNLDQSISLSWDVGEADHDGAIIERRPPAGAWVEIVELGPSVSNYVDGTVSPDARYEYRVSKIRLVTNQVCRSVATDPVGALTAPDQVTGFSALLGGGGTQLTWTDRNETTTGLILERSMAGSPWETLDTPTPLVSPYVDTGLLPNAQIEYRLAATNEAGAGAPVFAGVVTTDGPSLDWLAFDIDPTCFLRADGTVDLADGTTLELASATVSRSSGDASADETGFEAIIDDLSDGMLNVEWSVQDNQGFEASISQSYSIETTTTTRAISRVPEPALGLLASTGNQPINPGCSTCAGRRGHIETGGDVACVVNADSTASCWGDNNYYTLGQGESLALLNPRALCTDLECTTPFIANEVFAFEENSCATLGPNNELHCWGDNNDGELGNGTEEESARPAPVCLATAAPECTPLTEVVNVAGVDFGGQIRCAVVEGGDVYCWGYNSYGRILGATESEVLYATRLCTSGSDATNDCVPLTDVEEMALHYYHSCALRTNGRVTCWGWADQGQVGRGFSDSSIFPPEDVCASGVVWNDVAEHCGTGADDQYLNDAEDIAAGYENTCVVHGNGLVSCWGNNSSDGDLSDGTTTDRYAPSLVCRSGTGDGSTCGAGEPLAGAVSIEGANSSGGSYCAILDDGTAWCWGRDYDGLRGAGVDDVDLLHANQVCASGIYDTFALGCLDDGVESPLTDIRSLRLGDGNGCVTRGDDGEAWCWGDADFDALGTGNNDTTQSDQLNPGPVCASGSVDGGDCAPLTGQRYAGAYYTRGTAIANDGTVNVWGRTRRANQGSLLGVEYLSEVSLPVTLKECTNGSCAPATGVREITLGELHGCVVFDDGRIRCWGDSEYGELGGGELRTTTGALQGVCEFGRWNGTTCAASGTSYEPLAGIVQASASDDGYYTCAVNNEGYLYCWGSNSSGTLGNGTNGDSTPIARRVQCGRVGPGCDSAGAELKGIVSVEAGPSHVCAIHESGAVLCWGDNTYGQLGDGTNSAKYYPELVPLGPSAVQLATSLNSTCALSSDGKLHCWGDNLEGQLGIGYENSAVSLPTTVCESGDRSSCVELEDVRSVTGHVTTFCALLDDGGVRCWGDDANIHRLGVPLDRAVNPVTPCAPEPGADSCADDYACADTLDEDVIAVDLGGVASCALTSSGEVLCWGSVNSTRGAGDTLTSECTAMPVCTDSACATQFSEGAVRTCDVITVTEVP